MLAYSLDLPVKESASFKRIVRFQKSARIYPILPKGYYRNPLKAIWKKLTKLERARIGLVEKRWLEFKENLRQRKQEALTLWQEIKEIWKTKWEKVLIVPTASVISIFPDDEILGVIAWHEKRE